MIYYKIINDLSVDFSQYKDFPIEDQVKIYQIPLPDNIAIWADSLGLTIPVCELFVTPPGLHTGTYLHIDGDGTQGDVPKFNWATGVGEMVWMQPKRDNIKTIKFATEHGNQYLRMAKSSCIEVARTVVQNKTTLINASVPHLVDYTGDVPRYCVSITCFYNGVRPTFDKVLELIGNQQGVDINS